MGLDGLAALLKPENIQAVREGFSGLESAFNKGAERMSGLASASYPVISLRGVTPSVEYHKFWPEGAAIADGLRKASKGSAAARKGLDAFSAELPRLRDGVAECRKIADRTHAALGSLLQRQDKIETLLKNAPAQASRLADDVPRLGEELSRMLHETARLRDLTKIMRTGQQGLERTAKSWPELRKSLGSSAALLRGTQKQLRGVLDNRQAYEASLQHSRTMIEGLSAALPMYTDQWGEDVVKQERSLTNLGTSIDDVTAVMPEIKAVGSRLLVMTRLLLSLVGAIFLLHGGYLAIIFWMRQDAPPH